MTATDLYKQGKLEAAIEAQLKVVRANASDHSKRLFLFELAAFAGDLERARKQIDAINYGEPALDLAVSAYRRLLDAESARRRLFSEGLIPDFLNTPPEHVQMRLQAVNRIREKNYTEAREYLDRANDLCPPSQGSLNDKPFKSIRDCDDLFAGVLEVFAVGKYFWVPLSSIDSLTLTEPRFPRDLLWRPGRLEAHDGPTGEVFIPALYPGSHEHTDDQVRLGRVTDWIAPEGGPALGVGLKTFLVDDDASTILEWRQLAMSPAAAQ